MTFRIDFVELGWVGRIDCSAAASYPSIYRPPSQGHAAALASSFRGRRLIIVLFAVGWPRAAFRSGF